MAEKYCRAVTNPKFKKDDEVEFGKLPDTYRVSNQEWCKTAGQWRYDIKRLQEATTGHAGFIDLCESGLAPDQ